MSAAKYGLLSGLGQGLAQAGAMAMAITEERLKREWQEQYQNRQQKAQNKRQDELIAAERDFQSTIRREDRQQQIDDREDNQAFTADMSAQERSERREMFNLEHAFRVSESERDQSNVAANRDLATRELDLRTSTAVKNIEAINQEIEINTLKLDEARTLNSLFNKIIDPSSTVDEQNTAYNQYLRLTGKDRDDRYTGISWDEQGDFGAERRSAILNTRTGETRPINSGLLNSNSAEEDSMPDPAAYSGRTATDPDTGKRYRSNGSEWIEI